MRTTAIRLLGLLGLAALAAAPAWGAAPVVRTLGNGLKVAVFYDPRLPTVQIQVRVPAGTAEESDREHGAADLTAHLLTRGTTSRGAAEFADEIESLGGTVSASAALEYATLSSALRAADFEHGLELVADAVINPLFDDDEVAKARGEALGTLLQSRRYMHVLADEHVWGRAMRGHPYGIPQRGTLESVAGLTRVQIRNFHRECYRPDRALLAITGDVAPDRAFAAAEERFGGWKGRGRALTAPVPGKPPGFSVRLVDVPEASEAEIRLGLPGPSRRSPDAYAMMVANDMLGGPSSRLNPGPAGRVLRSYSSLYLLQDTGLIVLGTAVRNDSVPAAVERLRAELARFARQPPGEAAVAASRRVLARAFPVLNEAVSAQAAQWLGGQFYGLGDDFADRYPERILAVTADDVRASAARWFDPDHAELVVVGAASALEAGLRHLGPVEVVPVVAPAVEVAPAPAMRTSVPTADELARGRRLVDQAIAAHGGLAKLKGVKDSTVESDITIYSGERTVTGSQKEMRRDRWQLRVETIFPQFTSVQALNGDSGWMRISAGGDSTMDEDSLGVIGLRGVFQSDLVHLLLAAADSGAQVAYRGGEEIGTRPVDVVELVAGEAQRWVLFLDQAQHSLAALEENAGSPLAGPVLRRIYGDLRPEQGVAWPHYEERLLNGQRTMTLKTTQVQLNTGLTAAAFEKPVAKAASQSNPPRGR